MAGFGIFVDFLFFAVLGFLAATILAVALVWWGKRAVPASHPLRKTFIRRCARRPFLGLLWVLLSFVVYSYAIGIFFHRDNRLSTNPHAPLPSGFIIGSVDYQNGYIISPGMEMDGFPHDSKDCVAGVLDLQIAGPYLLGSKFEWPSTNKAYFILDTRSKSIFRSARYDEVKAAAASKGIELDFNEFGGYSLLDTYEKYRPIWFDRFFPVLSILGLSFLFGTLAAQALRLKRSSAMTTMRQS